MAKTLQLYDASTSVTLNLVSSTGFNAVYDTFKQAVPTDPHGTVIDTFTVTLTAANDDALAVQMIILGRLLQRALQYRDDDTQENEVWLQAQLTNEMNQRQAIVLGGSYTISEGLNTPQVVTSHIITLELAIEHGPWESALILLTTNDVSCLGGGVDISRPGVGDTYGRADLLYRYYATGPIDTVWCGFRSARKHGANSDFKSIWNCKDGTMKLADTTTTADATANSGTRVTTTFATSAAMVERFNIAASNVGTAAGQTGRFLVLARMKLSTGSDPINTQIRSGWYSSSVTPGYKYNDPVPVTGTSWKLYEMGTVKLPPMFFSAGVTSVKMTNAVISFLAQRVSGTTSSLHIDCFGMLPIDEGFAKVSGLYISQSGEGVRIRTTPKGTSFAAFINASANFASVLNFSQQNFYVPFDDEVYTYLFAQRNTGSVLGDSLDVTSNSYARYLSLRGSL